MKYIFILLTFLHLSFSQELILKIDKSKTLLVEKIIKLAKSKLGSPYMYGKAGENNFDCSGFIYYLFKSFDISLPRTSKAQSQSGKRLYRNLIKRGDILFFDTSGRGHINHSGLYLGDGKFIHASSGKAYGVTISKLDSGFYKDKFYWAVRKIDLNQ